MPEIPNITVSDESRSFVSSLTNITRDASQVESQTMREIDALRCEVMMLRSSNMELQQKFDRTSKTIEEMATIIRSKPIKIITIKDDESESVEYVEKVHRECSLDGDPAIVDS